MKGIKREGDFSEEAGGQNRLLPVRPNINTKNIQSGCRTPQEMRQISTGAGPLRFGNGLM